MEYTEQLVTMRCLSLLFFNFTKTEIDELKQVQEFNHCWSELEYDCKKKKLGIIPEEEFYKLFVSVSYDTQRAIIGVAFRKYEKEARTGIETADSFANFAKSFTEQDEQ